MYKYLTKENWDTTNISQQAEKTRHKKLITTTKYKRTHLYKDNEKKKILVFFKFDTQLEAKEKQSHKLV